MKFQALIPAMLCLLATVSLGETQPVLRVLAPSGPTEPVYHVTGGQSLKVEMVLESPARGSVEIVADLFQKSQSLLAPIQKEILVAKAVPSEENQAFRPLVSWTLPIPEVKRTTQMMARFRITSNGTEWTPAGQILITAYPRNFAKDELDAFAKTRGLHLFGSSDRLRHFLKAQQVKFDDAGDDLAALPPTPDEKVVYIGEANSREFADWFATQPRWRGNIIVFCSDGALLPGVFVSGPNGFQTIKVTLPLLDTLSTDPRSQNTLLEILHTLTTP